MQNQKNKKTRARYLCKVILFFRGEEGVRFGLVRQGGGDAVPSLEISDLMAIDSVLEDHGRQIGLIHPLAWGKFVARPHPQGWLFYLVEECQPLPLGSGTAAGGANGQGANGIANKTNHHPLLRWLPPAQAFSLVDQEEQKALAQAMLFISTAG